MPHKKSRKVRRGKKTGRKTMKGKRGGYYGLSGGPPIAPGAQAVNTGTEVPRLAGGKRSLSRRSRSRGRKMRGGSVITPVRSAGFDGTGENGMANYKPVTEAGFNGVLKTA